jgi:hypothetical protein
MFLLLGLKVASAGCNLGTWPGNEAYNSAIPLQMPFIAGEPWTVGGGGSFYGNNYHCNPYNDYYATDWNRSGDAGAIVLPIAKGTVAEIVKWPNCGGVPSLGCYVRINHDNGFQSTYGHLSDVAPSLSVGKQINTWDMIGKVGATGTTADHLHLSFKYYASGGYFSRCWNNGFACPNGDSPLQPQGYRPSPMMTESGPSILQDAGGYISVNGRIQLPDLRTVSGWTTDISLRNDGTEWRRITIHYFNPSGGWTGYNYCDLNPNQMCYLWGVATNGTAYVDGAEAVSVGAVRFRTSPQVYAIHKGINRPDSQVLLPLLHRYNNGTSSKIMIRNASTTGHTVTIRYQTSSGEVCPQNYYLSTNAAVTIDMKWVSCLANGVYGARITSDSGQPIAVVTTQELDANNDGIPESMMDYEGFPDGSYAVASTTSLYPLLKRTFNNSESGIMLQNSNGSANSIQISYFNLAPGGWCCSSSHAVGSFGASAVHPLPSVPAGFVGSGKATSFSGLAFKSITNEKRTGTNQSMSYAAVVDSTPKVTVPLLWKQYGGWDTGLSIQNGGTAPDTVRVSYYGFYGNSLATIDYSVPAGTSRVISPLPLSNGTIGTAMIESLGQQPIAVVANQTNASFGTADGSMTSTGVNR